MKTVQSKIATCILICCFLFGCGNVWQQIRKDPNAELVTAWKSFNSAITALIHVRDAGLLSEKDINLVDQLIDEIESYLNTWQQDVLSGKKRPEALDHVLGLVTILESYSKGKEKKQ